MLSERSQSLKTIYYMIPLYEMSKIDKSIKIKDRFRSNQSLSRVRLFATPWIAAHQASLSNNLSPSNSLLSQTHQHLFLQNYNYNNKSAFHFNKRSRRIYIKMLTTISTWRDYIFLILWMWIMMWTSTDLVIKK